MPVHNWNRVLAGAFHDFHNAWITHLKEALNDGLLPPSYYALGDQRSGDVGPDVLTLQTRTEQTHDATEELRYESANQEDLLAENGEGMIAVAQSPPEVSISLEADEEAAFYLSRRRTITIRHASNDRIVALIEIVSPANKHNRQNVDQFVDKVVTALQNGIHVLLIDLFPPSRHDALGMHGEVWERIMAGHYDWDPERPLTLASYCAQRPVQAYIEPLAIGSELIEMPLFLTTSHYIKTPLEKTYQQAYRGVPKRWRQVIEA